MAVVWAKSNGNWATASIWAFWNEATQQIEDYGQIPQSGDIVYCNSYTISQVSGNHSSIDVSNEKNPYTNLQNGGLNVVGNVNFGNIFVSDTTIITLVSNISFYNITFNQLTINGSAVAIRKTYGLSINITGNIALNNNQGQIFDRTNFNAGVTNSLNINGNIYTRGSIAVGSSASNNNPNINEIIINGNVYADNVQINIRAVTAFTINGNVETEGINLLCGIISNSAQRPRNYITGFVHRMDATPDGIIVTDYQLNNTAQYPSEDEVKENTEYAWGEKVGTYQQPPESVVLKGFVYDNGDKIGSLENQNIVGCVTKEDVREGVELIGLQEVGTLVVPSVDDVREGVIFDNGSVGTLIVQGGGDRIRIVDFAFYTNAQSDTFIVDLTDDKKPIFAQAEERVLLQNCPDIDLNDIAEPYYDDLFVRFLKYAVIVEYYRTAGVNSIFTPSEPTAEVVNKANTICEVWQNSANIYLKAWQKKYPNLVKKHKIML